MCLFVLLYLRLSFFLSFAPLPPSLFPSFSVLQPKSYLRSCSDLGKMLKPSQQVSLPLKKAAQQDPCLRAQPRLTLLQFYNKRQQLRRERLAHGHGGEERLAQSSWSPVSPSFLSDGRVPFFPDDVTVLRQRWPEFILAPFPRTAHTFLRLSALGAASSARPSPAPGSSEAVRLSGKVRAAPAGSPPLARRRAEVSPTAVTSAPCTGEGSSLRSKAQSQV